MKQFFKQFTERILKIPINYIVVVFTFSTYSIILIVGLLFFLNFHNQDISNNVADWGVVGDFFGGVLNPIISLLSLILLSYITILIAKETSNENKKIFKYEKRLNAYQEFTSYMPKIDIGKKIILDQINYDSNKFRYLRTGQYGDDIIDTAILDSKDRIFNESRLFSEYFHFLNNFEYTNGHLFKYNFKDNDFITLIDLSKEIMSFYDSVKLSFDTAKSEDSVYTKFVETFANH